MRSNNTTNQGIRYDKRLVKRLGIWNILLWSFVVIGVLVTMLESSPISNGTYDVWMMISVIFFWPAVILFICYIDGKLYLKTLEKAGFEVPINRKDFGNRLEDLLKLREIDPELHGRSRDSLILAGLTAVGVILVVVVAIRYLIRFQGIAEIGFMAGCIFVLALFWGIAAGHYYKQSDNTRFRNFYILDERRCRQTLLNGIVTILIAGVVSGMFLTLPFSMTDYVVKARRAEDINYAKSFVESMSAFLDAEPAEDWKKSQEILSNGADVLENTWQEDAFTEFINARFGVQSFDDFQAVFRSKDAKLWVRLTERGEIEATYSCTFEYGKTRTDVITGN